MADNVVETILVKLGLDGSNYNRDAEKAIKTNDKLNSSVKNTDKVVGTVAKTMARWFAGIASATGLVKLISDVARLNDQLGFLEKNLGMSSTTIKAWQGAAGAMGGSADGMTSSIKSLNMAMNDFKTFGDTSMLPYMNALGVSMVEANGAIRDTDKVMLDLADSFSKMDREQAFSIASKMGIDEGTFNTLVQGRKEMEKMVEYQKTMYQSSEAELKASRELQKNRALLGQHWESLKLMLGNAIIPLFVKLSEVALGIFEYLQKHKREVQAFFTGLSFAIGAVLTPILIKATIAALAFIAPFAPFIAVVTALGAAFGLLYDDYKTWAEGGKSLFDWGLFTNYIDGATLSTENLRKSFGSLVRDLINDTIPTLKGYADIVMMLARGDFKGAGQLGMQMITNFSDRVTGYIDEAMGQEKGTLSNTIGAGIANLIGTATTGSMGSGLSPTTQKGSNALLDMIAKGEVGTTGAKGYETMYRGSKVTAKGMFGKDLSQLTIGQVKQLQKASLNEQAGRGIPASKRSSAAGRYQFIYSGFDDYIKAAGLSDKDMFNPENQDAMAMAMLRKGKYGLDAVNSGKATMAQFQNNVLAARWASIKTTSGKGKYDNDGINKASHGSASQVASAVASMRQGSGIPLANAGKGTNTSVKNDVNINNVNINTTASTMTGTGQDLAKGVGNQIGMLMPVVQ